MIVVAESFNYDSQIGIAVVDVGTDFKFFTELIDDSVFGSHGNKALILHRTVRDRGVNRHCLLWVDVLGEVVFAKIVVKIISVVGREIQDWLQNSRSQTGLNVNFVNAFPIGFKENTSGNALGFFKSKIVQFNFKCFYKSASGGR